MADIREQNVRLIPHFEDEKKFVFSIQFEDGSYMGFDIPKSQINCLTLDGSDISFDDLKNRL